MNIIRSLHPNNAMEFREMLIENITPKYEYEHIPPMYLVLWRDDSNQVSDVDQIFIGPKSCKLISDGNAFGIAFDKRQLLLHCIGRDRCNKLNSSKKAVEKVLDKIESVLGKVEVVEELRKKVEDYQAAIRKVFDYENCKDNQFIDIK